MPDTVGERIQRVLKAVDMTQRALATNTGISQPTLSRIISGERRAKTPELAAIAAATGVTVAELIGSPQITDKVQFAARATNGAAMDAMYQQLLRFMILDGYLADHGIDA